MTNVFLMESCLYISFSLVKTFDLCWRATRTWWFASDIPEFRWHSSLTDSGVVGSDEIRSPDTYRDPYATSDGNVFKDINSTRRMINHNLLTNVFSGQHLVNSILSHLVDKQHPTCNLWMWTVAKQSSLKHERLEPSATLRNSQHLLKTE